MSRNGLGRVLDWVETAFGAAILAACLYGTAKCAAVAAGAWAAAGDVPATLAAAEGLAADPAAPFRLLHWGEAALAAAVGAALGVSSAEGAWWLLRRLAGGRAAR